MSLQGIIIGLGNPGPKYEATRHNMGFMVVDELLRRHDCERVSTKADMDLFKCFLQPGRAWLVGKPQSFMNRSGIPTGHVCRFYRLEIDQLLVLHDELDLPLGRMKLKTGGGLAGHNGLASIAEQLGGREFHRLRLGVGRPARGNSADYVLSKFPPGDFALAREVVEAAATAVATFAAEGPRLAQNTVNAFRPAAEEQERKADAERPSETLSADRQMNDVQGHGQK